MRSSPSTAAKSCRNRMCRQGEKYAVWVDFFHGDRKIGASRKLWGKEEEFKLGSRKQLFHARNFCGRGVQRGLPPRLDIRQPPLGVLWLLSVATESNRIASAEATEAAKKVKSAIEVTQDTSQIPSHIPSATDEKTLSRLHLPRKCPIMKRTRETCLFSLRSGKWQRSCFRFEEKIRFRQSDHAHWAAHAPGRAADFGFAADGLAGVL